MAIYIEGMEMPKNCHECVAGYGGCCFVAPADADGICPDHGRADFCPLIPVPDHGRLIDADATEKLFRGMGAEVWDDSADIIAEAQTVIPAEPPKEG